MTPDDVTDRIARSEGYRDNAHRTRVHQGKSDFYDQGCLTLVVALVAMVVVAVGYVA